MQIAHESEVKAQVGLAFRSVQRQEFKVIRSMAATQKVTLQREGHMFKQKLISSFIAGFSSRGQNLGRGDYL